MASSNKKVADKKMTSNEKSGKLKSKKDEIHKGVKRNRRYSSSGGKEVTLSDCASSGLQLADSPSSAFADHLLRYTNDTASKTSICSLSNSGAGRRLSSHEKQSTNVASVIQSHGNNSGIEIQRKRGSTIPLVAAQAMEFQSFQNSSSSESDDSSSDSSGTDTSLTSTSNAQEGSNSNTIPVSAETSEHENYARLQRDNPCSEKILKQSTSLITNGKLKCLSNEKKSQMDDLQSAGHVLNRTSGGNAVSLNYVKSLSKCEGIQKNHEELAIAKHEASEAEHEVSHHSQSCDTLLQEIICDFADFMCTIASKVSTQAGLHWTPKVLLQNLAEDNLKKTQKKKVIRDPNEPRRPLSSFNLWCEHMRKKLKEEEPNRSIGLQELANLWKLVSPEDRMSWEELAKEQKESYLRQMEVYKASCPSAPTLT